MNEQLKEIDSMIIQLLDIRAEVLKKKDSFLEDLETTENFLNEKEYLGYDSLELGRKYEELQKTHKFVA